MFARLMPHEGRFFTYFTEHAALILQGAVELKAMMDNMGETESRAHNIKAIETRADTVTYETIQLLHKTFITPIDRDEIHQLITRMDDILDLMEELDRLVGDGVRPVLDGLDVARPALGLARVVHHRFQLDRALQDKRGVFGEIGEEPAFVRHQACEHGNLGGSEKAREL